MNIEACEYRNAFLKYKPDIAVVTNIDPDHLDFFKTEAAYQQAFIQFMGQSRCVVILKEEYEKIQKKIETVSVAPAEAGVYLRESVMDSRLRGNDGEMTTLVLVSADYFEIIGDEFNGIQPGKYSYTLPELLVPGDHIRLDAQLAYVVSQLL